MLKTGAFVGAGLTGVPSLIGRGAAETDGAPRTVVLRSKDAETYANRAFPTRDEAYSKQGSWFTTGDDSDGPAGSDKMSFTVDPSAQPFNLGTFTLADIESIRYYTKKMGAPVDGSNAPNIYVNIYTKPDGPDDDAWYGRRLNWEPYLSNNLNAPADEWVQWSTDAGTNQLTFFDSNRAGVGFGFYNQPTLADLQSGPINWSMYKPGAQSTPVDYRDEEVWFFAFDTGSGWADDYEGYLDYIELVVNSGRGNSGKPTALRIELEE